MYWTDYYFFAKVKGTSAGEPGARLWARHWLYRPEAPPPLHSPPHSSGRNIRRYTPVLIVPMQNSVRVCSSQQNTGQVACVASSYGCYLTETPASSLQRRGINLMVQEGYRGLFPRLGHETDYSGTSSKSKAIPVTGLGGR
jgi:hypothetical protein